MNAHLVAKQLSGPYPVWPSSSWGTLGAPTSCHLHPRDHTGSPHPVVRQAQLAWKSISAVDTQPVIPRLLHIPGSIQCALNLQLDVDAPPDCLCHPALRISIYKIGNLILLRPRPLTLGLHLLQDTVEVNSKKQSMLRRQQQGGGWEFVECREGRRQFCPSVLDPVAILQEM